MVDDGRSDMTGGVAQVHTYSSVEIISLGRFWPDVIACQEDRKASKREKGNSTYRVIAQ